MNKSYEVKRRVTEEMTAACVCSGALPVFGTPVLAAMLEEAACTLFQQVLQEGETSVGVKLELEHLAATPVGMEVTAKAILTSREGKKACFDLEAWDEVGVIGRGSHVRVAVNGARFMEKTAQKGK